MKKPKPVKGVGKNVGKVSSSAKSKKTYPLMTTVSSRQDKAMAARGGTKPISKTARAKNNARRRAEGGYEYTMRGKVKTPKGFAWGGKTGP